MYAEQLVLLSEVQPRLEAIAQRYQQKYDTSQVKIESPVVKLENDRVEIEQEIKGNSILESLEFKVLRHAHEFYKDSTDGTVFKTFGGTSVFIFPSDERAFQIKTQYFKGKIYVKTGGEFSQSNDQILTLQFDAPHITEKDIHFFESVYEKFLPKESQAQGDTIQDMKNLGLKVITDTSPFTMDSLAGYAKVKEEIIQNVVFPTLNNDLMEEMRTLTHKNLAQRSYNCYIFHGPPGTGKTDAGKIVANELEYTFVELAVGNMFEKWYGETPKKVQQAFDLAFKQKKVLLYIDEIDKFLGDKEQTHEESAKVLSVILGNMTQTTSDKEVVVVASTNYPERLESAFDNRSQYIHFPYPEFDDLVEIYSHYAKHLNPEEIRLLATETKKYQLVGRDILTIAGRTMKQKIFTEKRVVLPQVQDYLLVAKDFVIKRKGEEKKIGFNAK